MSRAGLLVCVGLALAGLALGPVFAPTPLLIWNASASAPIGLYRLEPGVPPAVGERVAYRPAPERARWLAARGYLPAGLPLLKPVAAEAPSIVCRTGRTVTIDGRAVAEARLRDAAARSLPVWQGCVRLGTDTVFLLAPDVPDSLDGRYFGPVNRRDLLGRVTPIRVRETRP